MNAPRTLLAVSVVLLVGAGCSSPSKSSDAGAGCTASSQCDDLNPCTTDTCTAGACVFAPVTDGTATPGITPVTGTCRAQVCQGGVDTSAVDDTNLPAAVNDCGDPTCTNGTPGQSYTNHPLDSACSTYMTSQPGFCDGQGRCDQCTTASECPVTADDCQQPTCALGTCAVTYAEAGTPTTANPPQVVGDCQTIECAGDGGTLNVADDSDIPVFTPITVCKTGQCTNGVPSTVINAGMACAGTAAAPEVCDSTGNCGCQSDADCTSPQTCGGGGTALICGCTPLTSAACLTQSPPVTCGTLSDGCGGTVDCNQGIQTGSETGVDCGGGTTATGSCSVACTQGVTCKVTSDCASGLTCADGVCCTAACAGACEACTAAKKGQGQDGVCGPVVASQPDPHGQCSSQPMSSCGDEGGLCDGMGACLVWPTGTQCSPASCSGNTLTSAETCANGACSAPTPATTSCAPYQCSASGDGCTTTCNVDTDCASSDAFYCNASNQCVARLAQGAACDPSVEASQCLSNSCVDGFCCSSECSAGCQACSEALTGTANGTCANVNAGTPDPTGLCAATAASTCGTDGNCAAGGVCELYGSTTECASPSCVGDAMTLAASCSGSGTCAAPSAISCAPYACGATACMTSCNSSTGVGCASGYYCTGAGTCAAMVTAGAACAANVDCASGTCGGGFCCASTCVGGGACGTTTCKSGTGACAYPVEGSACTSATDSRAHVCANPAGALVGQCVECNSTMDCDEFEGDGGEETCNASNKCQ